MYYVFIKAIICQEYLLIAKIQAEQEKNIGRVGEKYKQSRRKKIGRQVKNIDRVGEKIQEEQVNNIGRVGEIYRQSR